MSKIQLTGTDINRLLNRFVSDKCSFKDGDLRYAGEGLTVHAKNIDLKTAADIEAGGLKISAKELKFNHEGADVDFTLG
ncbi:MAG: hypothetical protein WAX69_23575 [Victivallales bacterium]